MQYDKKLEGHKAIDFCLNDINHNKICLKDLRKKWSILFFFDKTSLESQNSELIYYSKSKDEFEKFNAEIIGVGPVPDKEIKKFCKNHDIKILILSDFDYKISEKYGVVYKDNNESRKILPITFLINKDGIVSKIWNREKMYYRFDGYADNLVEVWKDVRMWAHISKVFDAIEILDRQNT